jgi:glycosyltransferase involved in cell wall biosynthesis
VAVPPNAVIVSWWSFSTPLWYVQRVEQRRPDITIADDRTRLDEHLGDIPDVIDAQLGRKPDAMFADQPARVARLSYFFPAHNEEANLRPLVEEALAALPALAGTWEIIIVDDGSRDETPAIADALAAANPGVVRAVHHPTNLGYGAALRSGLGAARHDLVAFTDGDRQFRVADLGRLLARLAEPDHPDVVVGYRIRRADPLVRTVYARLYRLANRIFFGLTVRDVDCACKLFRRAALDGLRVESGGAFFSAELLIKLHASGRTLAEVGIPHYPRTAGSPTGARPSVVWRAVRDFWSLRLRLWAAPKRALGRGVPILEPEGATS